MTHQLSFDTHLIQAAVLQATMDSPSKNLSFAELDRKTGYSGKTLRDAIEELSNLGVGELKRGHFAISEIPDLILPAIVLFELKSRIMGRQVFAYKSIGSTNDTAKRLAESDAPEGAIVIAEKQTRGRGRLGRSWYSPLNKGLYFSLILRPELQIERLPALSLVAALSICRTIESMTSLEPKIKWPNDCLIGNKKVAGILVDISAELSKVSYAILGIGLNVNTGKNEFSRGVGKWATSLNLETGRILNRSEILRRFLEEFEASYNNFQKYGLRFIAPELVKRSSVIGRKIEFVMGRENLTGMALGYAENGGLRVQLKEGVKTLSGGEVSLKK